MIVNLFTQHGSTLSARLKCVQLEHCSTIAKLINIYHIQPCVITMFLLLICAQLNDSVHYYLIEHRTMCMQIDFPGKYEYFIEIIVKPRMTQNAWHLKIFFDLETKIYTANIVVFYDFSFQSLVGVR